MSNAQRRLKKKQRVERRAKYTSKRKNNQENQNQLTRSKRKKSAMEITYQTLTALGAVVLIIAGVVAGLGHRDAGIWTSCLGACLAVVAFFVWLQDFHWKKDKESKSAAPTKEQEQLGKLVSGQEEILARLRAVDKQHQPDFAKKFPLGYALFTMAFTKEVVPFEKPSGEPFITRWDKCSFTVSPGNILLKLPDIIFRPNSLFFDNSVSLPYVAGAIAIINIEPKAEAMGMILNGNLIRGTVPKTNILAADKPRFKLIPMPGAIMHDNDFSTEDDGTFTIGEKPEVSVIVEVVEIKPGDDPILVLGMRSYSP